MRISLILEKSDLAVDLERFLESWYKMFPEARSIVLLRKLYEYYPEYRFDGTVFRATEGSTPFVKPPTSWSKSQTHLKKYLEMSSDGIDDDWSGLVVSGFLWKALDLERMADDLISQGSKSFRIQEIARAGEVASLVNPKNLRVLAKIEGSQII